MTRKEYILLYERYRSGEATPEEKERLFAYRDTFDIGEFDNETSVPDQEQIRQRIYARIDNKRGGVRPQRSIGWLWWSAAAASLLFLTFTFVHKRTDKPATHVAGLSRPAPAITPGTNKAILILGNGGQIDLSATANGRISQAGKTLIDKVQNGQLVYEKTNAGPDDLSYNTIITPRGGQYQVVLADGTKVWLNAASSLKFPTAFAGTERHVELQGEAYFEVARNKDMPFTVSAGNVHVKVLGTGFNISAYEDDSFIKTTLLEGSVQLSQKLLLTPGQQAVSDGNGVAVKTVNVEDAVAWKNGYFSFRKENIRSVMRKIARWYDVDVRFQGDIGNSVLGGSVSRTKNIGDILSYLELTGIAHFSIEARTIVVKGN